MRRGVDHLSIDFKVVEYFFIIVIHVYMTLSLSFFYIRILYAHIFLMLKTKSLMFLGVFENNLKSSGGTLAKNVGTTCDKI